MNTADPRQAERMLATLDMLIQIHWYWSLPRRYQLIHRAQEVRRYLELTRPRYEQTVKNGINTPAVMRERWFAEAFRVKFITEKDFQRGDMLDDLRDYRLTCEIRNVPLCCPHFVNAFESKVGQN